MVKGQVEAGPDPDFQNPSPGLGNNLFPLARDVMVGADPVHQFGQNEAVIKSHVFAVVNPVSC
jgi:hypothetical protein